MELPPYYFERILAEFEADPRLGMAGGRTASSCAAAGGRSGSRTSTTSTAPSSATRASALRRSAAVQERLGWDTIDETMARMRGFRTRTFDRPGRDPPPPLGERRRHPARPRPLRRGRLHRPLPPLLGRPALAEDRRFATRGDLRARLPLRLPPGRAAAHAAGRGPRVPADRPQGDPRPLLGKLPVPVARRTG